MNHFGERLRQLRLEIGMSQDELAAKSGMLRQNLSKIETGETKLPKRASQERIAAAFGWSLAEFVERMEAVELAPAADDAHREEIIRRIREMKWTPEVAEFFDRVTKGFD